MLLQIHATLFPFDEDDGVPDVVGKGGAAAVFVGFADAKLGGAADVETAGLAETLKEAVEKDLGLALFVAGDVLKAPGSEFGEFFPVGHGQGRETQKQELQKQKAEMVTTRLRVAHNGLIVAAKQNGADLSVRAVVPHPERSSLHVVVEEKLIRMRAQA
jgi:hypothetical protein